MEAGSAKEFSSYGGAVHGLEIAAGILSALAMSEQRIHLLFDMTAIFGSLYLPFSPLCFNILYALFL